MRRKSGNSSMLKRWRTETSQQGKRGTEPRSPRVHLPSVNLTGQLIAETLRSGSTCSRHLTRHSRHDSRTQTQFPFGMLRVRRLQHGITAHLHPKTERSTFTRVPSRLGTMLDHGCLTVGLVRGAHPPFLAPEP
jgi:hypothetical protein